MTELRPAGLLCVNYVDDLPHPLAEEMLEHQRARVLKEQPNAVFGEVKRETMLDGSNKRIHRLEATIHVPKETPSA